MRGQAAAEDGFFEDFLLDVGRIGDSSQRYDSGKSADRNGSGSPGGATDSVGSTAACGGSAAVAEYGSDDEGRSVSSGKSEVLYGRFAFGGYGEYIFEVAVGV